MTPLRDLCRARLVTALVAVAAVAGLAVPAPAGAAPAHRRHRPHAPYAIGLRTVTFVDTSRPTAPNGTFPGAPSRTLPTLIIYPAQGDPAGPAVEGAAPIRSGHHFPLIVFSHGFGANGPVYEPLLALFVREGYVVAAPTFPLSNGGAPGGPTLDYTHQPGDVSFVITEMLRFNHTDTGGLRHVINSHRIGVAGHSNGAITTLGVAANSCCLDPRIDAAVAFSGIRLPFPNGTFFSEPTPPLMLVHGDADGTVPYVGSANAYAQAPAPKVFLTLLGAPHTPFRPPWLEPTVRSVVDFFDAFLKHHLDALTRLQSDGNVAGVTSLQTDFSCPSPQTRASDAAAVCRGRSLIG